MASEGTAPAVTHQQVMSAQHAELFHREDEHEPDYANMPAGHEQAAVDPVPMVNGIPPRVAAAATQDPQSVASDGAAQPNLGGLQWPLPHGNISGMTTASAHENVDVFSATGVTSSAKAAPLRLPELGIHAMPSPLPGQSPLSVQGQTRRDGEASMTSRAATWFSKLGDLFQQRRVEVTTWSQSPTGRQLDNPWTSQTSFHDAAGTFPVDPAHPGTQTPPSTGSAGVPREMVQAEVAKQLDGAMAEVYQNMIVRIGEERQRTEQAEQEAKQLRVQMEVMEQRMAAREALPESSGTARPEVLLGGLSHHGMFPAPTTMQDPLSLRDFQDDNRGVGVDPGTSMRLSMPKFPSIPWAPTAGLREDNGPSYYPPPPPEPIPVPKVSVGVAPPRSQSPSEGRGRGFLQGLFGSRSLSSGACPQPSTTSMPMGFAGPVPPPPGIAPPPTPAVASTNLGGNERVLTAMAKGIETLLMNQSSKSDRPETVKPGITELPSLPSYTPDTGSIDLINWVTHITPIMEDLSDSSSLWWSSMLQEVMNWYARYSAATPLERIRLTPALAASPGKPEWARVERRATAMMLTAIPTSIKEEVIASGGVNTLSLLAKLFSTYQPGNRQEKALVLANLEKPSECQDAATAVESLRKWALWRRRATAIGITEPDASVLLQGLDRICQGVVRADPELAFRVSLIRSTLQLDVNPTATAVTQFYQHLQAELEQQARLATTRTAAINPRLKALGTGTEAASSSYGGGPPPGPPPPPKAPGSQCRFFASEKGCRRGSTCRYPHVWSAFEKAERARRCLNCGAVGHKSRECKSPGGGAGPKPKESTPTTTPKDPPATPSSAPSSTGSSPTARRVNIDPTPDIAVKVMSVMQEIKNLQAFQPLLSAVNQWTSRWGLQTEKKALLDSGATHSLRPPHNEEEWKNAVDVSVALAGESRTVMKQNEAGTLLTTLDSVRVLREVEVSWWSCMIDYCTNGSVESGQEALKRAMFFDEEDRCDLGRLLLRRPNDGGWQAMKGLGLNRRTRKRLIAAPTWIVRWDPPGFTRKSDVLQKVGRMSEAVYINVGSMLSYGDLLAVWKVLLWAATQGRIGAVLSKDVGATTTEFEAHKVHRARVHLLHALAAAGQYYRGCNVPRLLIERRKAAAWDAVDWMCDGKAQRYCDELDLPSPLYKEEEAVEVVSGLTGVVGSGRFGRVRLARMSEDAAWRLHVMRNHQPFRRDCALCVRNAATGKQHRATMHPSGYCLSVDVAGPLKGYGRSPDGKFFKYFVIGAFRIPLLDGCVRRDEEVHGYPIPRDDPDAEVEDLLSEEEPDDDQLEEEAGAPTREELEKEREEWCKLRESFKAPLMTETLYFCVPVNSKKAVHVLPALQQMVVDVRALGYPVARIHSDRGGELRGNAVKRWILNQGILRTTSTGSEPAENGVAEAGVRYLKRRGRVLLDAAGVGREHWPTAIQTAALQQRCQKLSLRDPTPVAYGAKVYVKTKKYKTGDVESMKPHWLQGKYLGPSTDVRGGHVILKSTGTFLTTTHVRVAREPPSIDDVTPVVLVDSDDPPPLPGPAEPPSDVPEQPGERRRVEPSSSSGRGPRESEVPEQPGERPRVEPSSSSGRGRHVIDEAGDLPPYPKGPPITYSPPRSRVRTKSPGVRMRAMRAGDYEDMCYEDSVAAGSYGEVSYNQEEIMMRILRAQEKQAVEAVAMELLNAGDFSRESCKRLLRALGSFQTRWRNPRTSVGQGMVLGAYVQGASFGVTNHCRGMANTTKFLNKFLMIRLGNTMPGSTCTWTTLALQKANDIPAHRDVHNQRGTRNYVMEIADESLSGLWIEGDEDQHPAEGGDGTYIDHEYQAEDGSVHDGRLRSIENPVAFDPRSRHALVNEPGMKWVLSAYTPSGVQRLLQADVDFLFQQGFPVTGTGVSLPTVRAIQQVSFGAGARETIPAFEAPSYEPQFVALSGAWAARAEEEGVAVVSSEEEHDADEAEGDWELFVESSEESCVMGDVIEPEDEPTPRLRCLCTSRDPGSEYELLERTYEGHLDSEDCAELIQQDMAANLEEWEVKFPQIAKVEPEFTEKIEELIGNLKEPLRHTHNVNPKEVREDLEKWRSSIIKELGVVEKGFYRTTVEGVRNLKRHHTVQELPAKLVYTVKPPSADATPGTEAAYVKRKSRIVCCGNFSSADPGEVFASGAAAESLRCVLTLTALRRWAAGGVDIGGAFMLTPLPQHEGATLYSITPPAILVLLGLATPGERWILTHAMYGLRQSPQLWSSFRDATVRAMDLEMDGVTWKFVQGEAEPNVWLLFETGNSQTTRPSALLLIYVDDLLICGPRSLVQAIAQRIGATWKISELEIVEPHHGIRFLGCEIETNESRDTYWIHQKPYVMEILRHHEVPATSRSPVPCPRDLLTLHVEDDEAKGTDLEVKQAQKMCGELLWLSQRSRPDIAFPVSIMGSLITKAAPRSIQIGTRLLSYLQRTSGMALELKPTDGGFQAWSDCSFAPSGNKSHSGMAISWHGAVIAWRSARQPFTCLSTAEGELTAALETLTLSMSLKAIVDQFGDVVPFTTLCVDNQAALTLANPNSSASWRTRHLRIRASFLRERVDQGEVLLKFVPGKYQLADLLTKGFPRQRLEELNGLWGLVDLVQAVAQVNLIKVIVMMSMMVQSARARSVEKEPLPLETSWELYIAMVMLAIVVVVFWECGWNVWYYVTGQETPAQMRRTKRLRKMQEAIKEEITMQMASTASPTTRTFESSGSSASSTTPPPPPDPHPTARPTTSSWTPTSILRGKTIYKDTQRDKATQIDCPPLICYQDRAVHVGIVLFGFPIMVMPFILWITVGDYEMPESADLPTANVVVTTTAGRFIPKGDECSQARLVPYEQGGVMKCDRIAPYAVA
ncbi:unnamed protein product [Symbiodinium sp. CCMP2592]|nr:unnamed protein product [Symbiodinium sp. CCMP2592]